MVWPDGDIRWVHSLGAALATRMAAVHAATASISTSPTASGPRTSWPARATRCIQSEKLAALGSLLAGVSHELNNPLAAIVGQAEMLQEDSARHGVRGARAQDRRRGRALRPDRADLPRHGAAARAAGEPGRLNDLIASSLELTEYALRTAGIAVRVNFGTGLPLIQGDRDQLHQVLVNLIVNAQQAMEDGETFEKALTIRTSVDQAGRC